MTLTSSIGSLSSLLKLDLSNNDYTSRVKNCSFEEPNTYTWHVYHMIYAFEFYIYVHLCMLNYTTFCIMWYMYWRSICAIWEQMKPLFYVTKDEHVTKYVSKLSPFTLFNHLNCNENTYFDSELPLALTQHIIFNGLFHLHRDWWVKS